MTRPIDLSVDPDFRTIFEAVPGGLVVFDRDLTIVAATDAYLAGANRERAELLGRCVFDAFPDNPDDPAADGTRNLRRSLDRVLRQRVADAMPVQRYDVQDPETGRWHERFWQPLNIPVLGTDGELDYIIQRVEEVTADVQRAAADERASRALRSTQEQLEAAQRMARMGSWEYLIDTGLIAVSDGYRHLFALGAAATVDGLDGLEEPAHPDDRAGLRALIEQARTGRGVADGEYRTLAADGVRIVHVRCVPVRENGVITAIRGTVQDITAIKRLEEENAALLAASRLQARTDDLTGLPNRRAWEEQLRTELARAARGEAPLAVALLDLDRFKDFNDTHGHGAGDALLVAAAKAWRAALRETDVLARHGGEEFALALPDCTEGRAREALERLRAETPAAQTFSVGLAIWDGAESAEELIARTDAALYAAKRAGRDRVCTAPEPTTRR